MIILEEYSTGSFNVTTSDKSWSIDKAKSGYTPVMYYLRLSYAGTINCNIENLGLNDGSISMIGYCRSVAGGTYSTNVRVGVLWRKNI